MSADYTIACDSERYRFGISLAIASVFLYPIGKCDNKTILIVVCFREIVSFLNIVFKLMLFLGVPLFYHKVLHSHRDHIVNRGVPYLLTNESGEPFIDENFPDDFKVDENKTKIRDDALHSVRFLYYQYEPQV